MMTRPRLVSSKATALFARVVELTPPRRRTWPDEWARANRTYPPSSGVPGPRDPGLTGYLIPFGRAVAGRRYRRCVMVCAAQSGKSETLLDIIGQRLDEAPVPTLYVGPSRQFVGERFEPRIMALFDEAPSLSMKLTRGRRMSKTRKLIGGVPLALAHAGSSTALKSDAFGLAITDEADELLTNVRGQGDPFVLIDARGASYSDFTHAIVSTPSEGQIETVIDPVSGLEFWSSGDATKIPSAIWRMYLQGTRHAWAWQCPHCSEWFVPRLANLQIPDIEVAGPSGRLEKRAPTPSEAERLAWFACTRCGAAIGDDHKAALNAGGVVIAPGQTITTTGEVIGEPAPNGTWSCFASGLCSPFRTFGQCASEYVAARTSGEHDRLQAVVNSVFGEPYGKAPIGAMKWQALKECCQPYVMGEVPREVMTLVAGVDVQRRSLYYTIRGFGSRGSSWLVGADQLHGDTSGDEVWSALSGVLNDTYAGMRIQLALIDSGFRPDKPDAGDVHKVYDFCRRWSWLVKPTKGAASRSTPLTVKAHEVDADGKVPRYSVELVTVDTDFFKSLVMSRVATPAGQWGAFALPSDIADSYCKQVLSETREIIAGKPVWTRVNRDNHYFDCEILCAVAGRMLNVERIPDGFTRDWDLSASVSLEDRLQAPPSTGTTGGFPLPPAPTTPRVAEGRSFADQLADRAAARAAPLQRGGGY